MTPEEVAHACGPDTEHCSCVPHLRAEIERLRERLEVRTQHGHNLRTMLESATETERAAVVMYLYKRGGICIDVADDIGRGLHRREEKP